MTAGIVDAQVDAYNRHDLDAFLACYSPDVTVRNGDGDTVMTGIDSLRKQYSAWFTQYPDLHVEIRGRVESGSWVVDAEHVTMSGHVIDGLVGYHIAGGRIDVIVMLVDAK